MHVFQDKKKKKKALNRAEFGFDPSPNNIFDFSVVTGASCCIR